MKFSRHLMGLSALIFAGYVMAEPKPTCPPTSMVSSVTFTKAHKESGEGMWSMLSNFIDYEGKKWDVLFATDSINATAEVDALKEAQTRFNAISLPNDPLMEVGSDGVIQCSYLVELLPHLHFVLAQTPPFAVTGTQGTLAKGLR